MPARRIPEAKAALTGALANHPERYRNRKAPEASGPIGPAPAFLLASEKKSWKSFAQEWSWLTNQDRPALVALCQMRSVAEDNSVEKNAAFYSAYRMMLADFGGTPVSRTKVFQPKEEVEDDPFAKFDGKVN